MTDLEAMLWAKLIGTILGVLLFWFVVRPWLNRQCK